MKHYPLIYWNNAQAAESGNFIRIAVSTPIGSNLDIAQEMLRGVAQAQDEVNKNGGIDGAKLQVVIINDENNPAIAEQVATALVKETSILAVVGHNASDASLVAAPIYQQGKLVMISPTSFASDLTRSDKTFIFRMVPTPRFMPDQLVQYIEPI